jgi:orotate phosphoribosyltransferase
LARKGHFVYESGHHGDTWLDLDLLISQPRRLRTLAAELAGRLAQLDPDLVCGPLEGGAFLGQWVAAELGTEFAYTNRAGLPAAFDITGRRAVVVDDAVNVGFATTAAAEALRAKECTVLGVGSVLVCAPAGLGVGSRLGVPQVFLEEVAVRVWPASECPLC